MSRGGPAVGRRTLLAAAAGLALPPARSSSANRPFNRSRPGDRGWPTAADWRSLNDSVAGRLLEPRALLANCQVDASAAACRESLRDLANPFFLGDHVSGTQVSGWYRAWTPAPSARAVAARDARDVAAAVIFARRHRLRLVIKGGGHSYQGTSNASDSLLIWTRPMRAVTVHETFTPRDCQGLGPPSPAVSVGAGAIWLDAYQAVTTRAGRYVQGGGCTTVGVAGHVQSGGFGSFSKAFGTAAGSLLEAEVVTADGMIRVVNARRDPDLFWALKGGGGGTFGVITRLTLLTHPLPTLFAGVEGSFTARSPAAFRALIARFVGFYAGALCNAHWGEQASVRPPLTLKITMVAQGLTEVEIRRVWAPFLTWAADPANGVDGAAGLDVGVLAARGMWDVAARQARGSKAMVYDARPEAPRDQAWWSGDQEQVGAFLHGYDSLWLPADLLREQNQPKLVDALFAGSRLTGISLHFNKGLAGAPPDALARSAATAMNPAVLSAFALAIVANGGPPAFPGVPWPIAEPSARKDADSVIAAMHPLLAIAPEAGSYVAESNYFNPRWQAAYWGPHFERLRRIKQRYDAGGLFYTHHGVGSESWGEGGFTRLTGEEAVGAWV